MKKIVFLTVFISTIAICCLNRAQQISFDQPVVVKNSHYLDDEVVFNPQELNYFNVLKTLVTQTEQEDFIPLDNVPLPVMKYLKNIFEKMSSSGKEIKISTIKKYLEDDPLVLRDRLLEVPLTELNTSEITLENIAKIAHFLDNPLLFKATMQLIAQKITRLSKNQNNVNLLMSYINNLDLNDIVLEITSVLLKSNQIKDKMLKALNKVTVFKQHKGPVYSVACNPVNNLVASGSYDGTIKIWDINTPAKVLQSYGNYGSVYAIAWHPTGRFLAAAQQKDSIIRLIDYDTPTNKPFEFYNQAANQVAWGHRNSMLALSYPTSFGLWDFNKDSKNLHIITVGSLKGIAWNHDDTLLALAGPGNNIAIYNAQRLLQKTFSGHTKRVNSVSYDPKGSYLVSGGADNRVMRWDAEGKFMTLKKQPPLIISHNAPVTVVSWSPQGSYIASGDNKGALYIWDRRGRFIKELSGHEGEITSLSWSKDGSMLVSGSYDKRVNIWYVSPEFIKNDAPLWDIVCLVKIVQALDNDERYCSDNPYFDTMSITIKELLIKNRILLHSSDDNSCIVS